MGTYFISVSSRNSWTGKGILHLIRCLWSLFGCRPCWIQGSVTLGIRDVIDATCDGAELVMSGRLDAARDVFLLLHFAAEFCDQISRLSEDRQLLVQELLPLSRVRCNVPTKHRVSLCTKCVYNLRCECISCDISLNTARHSYSLA